jgi:hypothetical protein
MSATMLVSTEESEAAQPMMKFLDLSDELIVYIFSFCDVQELVCYRGAPSFRTCLDTSAVVEAHVWWRFPY